MNKSQIFIFVVIFMFIGIAIGYMAKATKPASTAPTMVAK